jgi:L-rhamnose isomerase
VRPLVAKARLEKGLPVDPLEEHVKSEYQRKIESKRG